LGDSVVTAIAVDKKGIIWIGGSHNGITSYNDTVFKVYDTTDGLPHFNTNGIRGIVIDRHNVKWFASDNGLLKYNDTTWTWYLNSGLISIENIALDTMGYVWVGTTLSGATVFNGNNFHTYMKAGSGLPDDRVCAIGVDKQNNKWFGTEYYGPGIPGGVTKFDGTNWTTYTTVNGLANNYVGRIYCDRFGNLWFSTLSGLTKYNPNVGINDIKANETKLYPNPAKDHINIFIGNRRQCYIYIYNAIGSCVLQKECSISENHLNIESFTKGIYFYTLIDKSGIFNSGKFIKK